MFMTRSIYEMNPMFFIDFYKSDHRSQYPDHTTEVYSNFTARKSRIEGIEDVVFFGLQYAIKEYLIERFTNNFFKRDVEESCEEYKQLMEEGLNIPFSVDHIRELHDLQYLPIEIRAIPEGTIVPLQVPNFTIVNTAQKRPENFAWLTNYLETLLSVESWKPSTSATMAHEFRKNFEKYAKITGASQDFIDFQGHDFSFRGMSNVPDACVSGVAHLLSFKGTDTVPAIMTARHYYKAEGFVGGSVPATEHSVMCAGDEFETVVRLLTKVYPKGIVSIVADSYDFWRFVTQFLPSIKDIIMNRDGKLVVRPDTGTPHLIINGDPNADNEVERMGLCRCLYKDFGGTINNSGYVELDSHIGSIYGDSIDIREQVRILSGLEANKFASSNCVLGIGSYTYQYVTRDTFGFVCKATNCVIDGQSKAIFKSPKTGAWKKSHRGLLHVADDFTVTQDATREQANSGMLVPVFRDGKLLVEYTLNDIRNNLARCRAAVV